MVSGIDLLPTLCDYANIAAPRCTGSSLRPLIENPEVPGRPYLVSELTADRRDLSKRGRMVRTQHYKYIALSEGDRPELLFCMKTDPGEIHNLAYDASQRKLLSYHRQLLEQWISKTDDTFEPPSSKVA